MGAQKSFGISHVSTAREQKATADNKEIEALKKRKEA
jgi:hypothetical protein